MALCYLNIFPAKFGTHDYIDDLYHQANFIEIDPAPPTYKLLLVV